MLKEGEADRMAGKLKVTVEGILDDDKEHRIEFARFLGYGDAMIYVKAKMANPGMLWALIITRGKEQTRIYLDPAMCGGRAV